MPKRNKKVQAGQYIYCKYITKNGRRIYPKNAKAFRFIPKPKAK